MASALPDRIDPRRLARTGERVVGVLPADRLERLGEALDCRAQSVAADLCFGYPAPGIPSIDGVAELSGYVQCQRCLAPMRLDLRAEIGIAVLEPGAELPPGLRHEPFELEGPRLSLWDLVEDELLLALPDYPAHEGECRDAAALAYARATEPQAERRSPFAVLASLKGGAGDED